VNIQKQEMVASLLGRALRSAIPVTNVNRRFFQPGLGAPDTVITTCRFILILEGEVRYTIEGNSFVLKAGTQFLVPSWCRRDWTVPGTEVCELIWCEFDDDPKEIGRDQCFRRELSPSQVRGETRAYLEMARRWKSLTASEGPERELLALELEGLLKSMLARFWPQAELASSQTGIRERRLHPEIKRVLRWLEDHFMHPDVLERLQEESDLTPNYFRLRFREVMGCSPGEYVKRLRLRQARYLLCATQWQHKRIAAAVGYGDALYFSRLYREFWGRTPTAERQAQRRGYAPAPGVGQGFVTPR
jgi:AraC-like DNA-binding protein